MTAAINPLDLSGRTVLVTGASAGIGRATAVLLSRLGARVVVTGRDLGRLLETLQSLAGEGHLAEPFDLSELDAVPAWLKGIAVRTGPLAGLAHCAGIQALRPIRVFSAGFFDQMMRTNLGSALALARGFRQKGCHTDTASLVFVSSTAATAASPGNVVYAASKGGLISATKGLAIELLGDGIRVNCIVPAIVDTELIDRVRERLTADQIAHLKSLQPLGFGHPDDVGHMVAYLIADTGRWITGAAMTVDGGQSA